MELSNFKDIITKIEGVISVKIVDEDNIIKEVHILANDNRAPKQIVRDIESSLMAAYDYRIDRKVISIAQIHIDEVKEIRRIRFSALSMNTDENLAECSVTLIFEEEEYTVAASALKTAANRRKIIAEATIKAVEKILGQAIMFDIQDVVISTNRDVTFVSVIVNMIVAEKEEVMLGSAIVKNDVNEAIVKATLDSINRKIEKNC